AARPGDLRAADAHPGTAALRLGLAGAPAGRDAARAGTCAPRPTAVRPGARALRPATRPVAAGARALRPDARPDTVPAGARATRPAAATRGIDRSGRGEQWPVRRAGRRRGYPDLYRAGQRRDAVRDRPPNARRRPALVGDLPAQSHNPPRAGHPRRYAAAP